MSNITKLNNTLDRVVNSTNYFKAYEDIIDKSLKIQSLNLVEDLKSGETKNGVTSISNANLKNKSFTILSKDVPEIKDQVIKNVDSETELDGNHGQKYTPKTGLEKITGSTPTDENFLNATITSQTAEGLKASLGKIADVTDDKVNSIISGVVPEKVLDVLPDALKSDYNNLTSQMKDTVSNYTDSFRNLLSGNTGNVFLDAVLKDDFSVDTVLTEIGINTDQFQQVLGLVQNNNPKEIMKLVIQNEIDNLLVSLPPATKTQINNLLASEDFEATVKILSLFGVDINITEIQSKINNIDLSPSSKLTNNIETNTPPYNVKQNNNTWDGANTPEENFHELTSEEELMIEFNLCEREITRMVFMGYTIEEGQSLTAQDIHQLENDAQLDGINAHYIIRTDGVLQRGRPLDIPSDFDRNNKKYTILVGLVHKGDKINTIQSKSVESVLKAYYNTWPGGSIYSAQFIDVDYPNPGFDITTYIKLFDKKNYGSKDQSISTADIIQLAQQPLENY